MNHARTALLSAFRKDGLEEFGRNLSNDGLEHPRVIRHREVPHRLRHPVHGRR